MSDEQFPPQQQPYPGRSGDMQPEPHDEMRDYVGRGLQRAAQPDEIAPSYVFFASETLSSYYTGEVLAPTGGETLPG